MDKLLELAGFKSANVVKLLRLHFTQGNNVTTLVNFYGATRSNMNRDIGKLNKVAQLVQELHDMNTNHLSDVNL